LRALIGYPRVLTIALALAVAACAPPTPPPAARPPKIFRSPENASFPARLSFSTGPEWGVDVGTNALSIINLED
jgi:hypothetical protein